MSATWLTAIVELAALIVTVSSPRMRLGHKEWQMRSLSMPLEWRRNSFLRCLIFEKRSTVRWGNAFLKWQRRLLSVIELCNVQQGKVRIIIMILIIIIIGNAA
jgi:hypothetical protein